MKILVFLIYLSTFLYAQTEIDSRYDNFDGEALIFKLIEDNQWTTAQSVFRSETANIQKRSPADYRLIQGLILKHDNKFELASIELLKSLNFRYSDLALDALLVSLQQLKRYGDGLDLLNRFLTNRLNKKVEAEISFLSQASIDLKYTFSVLNWLENSLNNKFDFAFAKLYTHIALKNKIVIQTQKLLVQFLLANQFSSPEEALAIMDEFLIAGFDADAQDFLEIAQLKFPKSDLLKLNLAQILFKKEKLLNALVSLSRVKSDDGLLNVQIELMNLMQVKSYSLFHKIHVTEEMSHLKNWVVYLINNEDWVALYSLNPKLQSSQPPQHWINDEVNYALAYSAASVHDKPTLSNFTDRILSPQWAPKKEKLLQFLSE